MKKVLIFFVCVLMWIAAYSQTLFPSTQNIGNTTTLVNSRGGLTSNVAFIMTTFADTATANSNNVYTKSYQGSLIFTTSDSCMWYRAPNANKWIRASNGNGTGTSSGGGGGGGGTVNALTNGLTLTGSTGYWGGTLVQNTTIAGAGYKLRFDNLDSFAIRYGSTKRIEIGAASTLISSPDYQNFVSTLNNGINLVTTSGNGGVFRDTAVFLYQHIYIPGIRNGDATDSVLVWNASAGEIKKRNVSSFGGGSVTTFSSGNLSPLFTTSVANASTSPALSFTLSNAAAKRVYWNNQSSTAAPAFNYLDTSAFGGTWITNVQAANQKFAVEDSRATQARYFSGANAYNMTFDSLQFIVKGVYGEGLAIPSYTGAQMFFNPKKAAFRAGEGGINQWLDINVGPYSTAFGSTTVASGDYSFAQGISNQATNTAAVALGNGNLSSGSRSFTMGLNNTAAGYTAFVINDSNYSGSHHSFTAGYRNGNNTYSGTVIGQFNDSTEYDSPTAFVSYGRAFQIGGGTATADRKNIFTVLFDGRTIIGNSVTRDTSAILKLVSTTKGFLMPVVTGTQMNAIPSPSTGLIIYNTDSSAFCYYNGSIWQKIGTGSGGVGTVVSVAAGNGMNFSTITGTGTVTMGTPSSVTLASTNSVSGTTHTHAFAPGGTSSQVILGDGTLGVYNGGAAWLLGTNAASAASDRLGTSNNVSLRIVTNATERMVVDSNGRVGIGTAAPNASSILDLTSTTRGALVPRMNGTQQAAISSPATGLLIYNTDSVAFVYYNGAAWIKIGAATTGASGTVTNIATGYGISGGPITTTGTLIADSATLFTALLNTISLTTSGSTGAATWNPTTRILNIPQYTTSGSGGTVTLIQAGNGMSFTDITTSGSVTMGTPSNVTLASTNSVSTGTHTHAFVPGGTSSQVILGDGTLGTYTSSVGWLLSGNSISAGTDFLGTTNNTSLRIRTNNTERVVIDSNGRIGFGTTAPSSTALLDMTSTTQGLLTPRMNGVQQAAISSPATGLLIYNTDSLAFCYYTGSNWVKIGSTQAGSGTVIAISQGYGVVNTPNPITTIGTIVADSSRMFQDVLSTIQVTTVGTSGAATWTPATRILNIPQYIGGGGGSGFTTLAPIGSSPNANGASSSGVTLNLEPANGTYGGVISTSAQTMGAGVKTFTEDIIILGGLTPLGDPGMNVGVGPDRNGGSGDTRVGVQALNTSAAAYSGYQNTAIGFEVLEVNTSGYQNVGVGAGALPVNTTGAANVAVGVFAMNDNTTGSLNTAVGKQALTFNISGSFNVAVGAGALNLSTTASNNTAVGNNAATTSTIGNGISAFGSASLENNTASGNSAFGYASMRANTTGTFNVAFGYEALRNQTTAGGNSAFGYQALYTTTTGSGANTAIGQSSMYSNTTGSSNTGVGYATLYSNTTGVRNTSVGTSSMLLNTISTDNTAVGFSSLATSNGGDFNTMVGSYSGRIITTGDQNTGVGANALFYLTTGQKNVAVGAGALENATTGGFNVALGQDALLRNTTGSGNIGIGWNGGSGNYTGINNISIGYGAALTVTGGDANIFIGRDAGWQVSQNDTVTNSIAIGYQSYTTKDNLAVLGASTITETWLRGKVGVNVENPDSNLQVNGGLYTNRGVRHTNLPTGAGTKALRINASTGVVYMADTVPGGGSGSRFGYPNEDTIATSSRYFNTDANSFIIDSIDTYVLRGNATIQGGNTARIGIGSEPTEAYMVVTGVALAGETDNVVVSNGSVSLLSENSVSGNNSSIILENTYVSLRNNKGLMYVDSLTQAASMTSRMVMVRNVANNQWEEISSSSIVSGGGGLTAITANNGLSTSSSSNVQLGGNPLVQNTTISTSAFNFNMLSSNGSYTAEFTNSSTGHAVSGANLSTGAGVSAYSAGGFGIIVSSAATYAINAQTETAATNTIINTLLVDARTTGSPAANLGTGILFQGETSTTAGTTIGQVGFRWSTVTHASRTSEFVVSAVNAASTREMMVMNGVGYTTFTGQYYSAMYTLTDAATIALDWNNGNCQVVTLGGSRTFTFANPKAGARYLIELIQGGSGSYTITWPTIKWQGGVAPTLTTTVGKTDLIFLLYDGTSYFGSASLNF